LIWKDWLIIEVLLLGIDLPPQPTEQFENNLFSIVQNLNPNQPIWVEDESRLIGQVAIPDAFYTKMRDLPVYFLDVPLEERTKHLVTTQVLVMIN
jgi:tRNA 2-selenouridine synthase